LECSYDAADQLLTAVQWSTAATPAILKRHAYNLGAAGNRATEQVVDAGAFSRAFSTLWQRSRSCRRPELILARWRATLDLSSTYDTRRPHHQNTTATSRLRDDRRESASYPQTDGCLEAAGRWRKARMPECMTYRGTVYPWQCDHMGHMNVMWYAGKFDEASWQFLAALGLARSRFREEGAGMAAVEQRIEYQRELHAGDVATVPSAVLEVKERAIRILHDMRNDDPSEVAATTVVGAHIDALARRARPLPADVRERAVRPMREEHAIDQSVEGALLEPTL